MESVAALTSRGFVGERSAGWGVRVSVGEACSDMLVDIYCHPMHGSVKYFVSGANLSGHPALKLNGKSVQCWLPIPYRHCPFLG